MKITTIAGVSLAVLIVAFVLNIGIRKSEVAECMRLKSYSEQFEQFWLTEWQSEMCQAHNIEIDAPVGSSYDTQK